jgi:hypothetical protein
MSKDLYSNFPASPVPNGVGTQPSEGGLWTATQVASYLGCSVKVLSNWRVSGSPIPFVKIGTKMVRYRREAVEAFVAANTRTSTSDQGGQS